MIQLRPYQLDGVNNIREAFRTHQRILYVAPTGSGKTVQFAYICAKAIEKGSTVLVLSHRVEIFKQNLKAVSNYTENICLIDADNRRIDGTAKLFCGMVETFKRRMNLFKDIKIDLIICDEAHTQTYYKIFDAFPNVKVLGVTGSPVGKKLHLYYNVIVESIGIPELIEQGFLCRCLGYEMRDDFSDLKMEGDDFSDKSNFEHFSKAKIFDGLIEKYLEKCVGKKVLVFCVNVEHSEQTVRAFKSAGVMAYAITSETSDVQREWILREYGRSFHVLVNCNILNSGFDDPSIEVVMFNRATSSLIFWLQGCGRGSRPLPEKNTFMVIDLGGNFRRLGLWSAERIWELDPPKKKKKSLGAATVRSCASCGAMLPAQQKKCEYCGYEMADKERELLKGELVEVKESVVTPKIPDRLIGLNLSECSLEDLVELENVKALRATFVWKVVRSRGEADIISYANLKGYRNAWSQRQILQMDQEWEKVGGAPKTIDFKIHDKLQATKVFQP